MCVVKVYTLIYTVKTMTTPELIAYIKKRIAAGVPQPVIEKALMSNGWPRTDIAQAFAEISGPVAANVLPIQTFVLPNYKGRKIALSLMLIGVSLVYAFYQYTKTPQQTTQIAVNVSTTPLNKTPVVAPPAVTNSTQPASTSVVTTAPQPVTTPVATPITTPVSKPSGQYTDGTYTGAAENAYYGTLQVAAVIQNGAIADVKFLQYANDRSTSRYINAQAMPQLTQEAISVQSANVDIVSGATFTSEAFQKSLASALAQAKN